MYRCVNSQSKINIFCLSNGPLKINKPKGFSPSLLFTCSLSLSSLTPLKLSLINLAVIDVHSAYQHKHSEKLLTWLFHVYFCLALSFWSWSSLSKLVSILFRCLVRFNFIFPLAFRTRFVLNNNTKISIAKWFFCSLFMLLLLPWMMVGVNSTIWEQFVGDFRTNSIKMRPWNCKTKKKKLIIVTRNALNEIN